MSDEVNLGKDDYKRKSFKTAPGGTYAVQITVQTKIKKNAAGDGNNLNVHAKITKGPHKGITFFDNIAPHVGWKVAQLLAAIGKKITGKTTLQKIAKLVAGKAVRALLKEETFNGKKQNKVVQWLPPKSAAVDDEDLDEKDEEDADDDDDEDQDEDADETDDEEDDADEDDDASDDDEDDDADEDDDDADDDDDDDDADVTDEDDEEEAPKKKSKKAAPKAKAKAKKKVRK